MACLVGVSRGKGQREIKAHETRWTRKNILSRAPIGVRECYTFHGPLSLRGWATGKVKGEDKKKIHTRKNSREKKFIQPEQAERHTYKLRRRKNMHTRQTKIRHIQLLAGLNSPPHTSPFFFLTVLPKKKSMTHHRRIRLHQCHLIGR